MTDLPIPRPRSRVAPIGILAPAPRTRARPVASPPTPTPTPAPRSRAPVQPVAPAKPSIGGYGTSLPFGMSHNGVTPHANAHPDPRFTGMVIVPNPTYKDKIPRHYEYRIDKALEMTADKVEDSGLTVPFYFTELGLRRYLKLAMLDDAIFKELENIILSRPEDKWDKTQATMMKRVPGGLEVDLTKATGPFTMDVVLTIEAHYSDRTRPFVA